MRKTTKIILITAVVMLIVARVVLPSIILARLNTYLAHFSPVYAIHIGDLDLGVLTLSYAGKDTEGRYKKDDSLFFKTKNVRVQISFVELLHGRILTNVQIEDGTFILTKALLEGSRKPTARPKEAARLAAKKMFPLRIAVIELHKSSLDFSDFVSQDSKTQWRVSDIEAKILNINPLPENPYSSLFAEGKMLDKYPFKIVAKAKRLEQPLAWKADIVTKDFFLPAVNSVLLYAVPFSFTKGSLDLYSEIKYENGQLLGYIKLFMKDVQVLHAGQDFKSVKHFAFEVAGAFANFMLKRADDKALATKISFKEKDGHFSIEGGEAALAAIKHGYVKPLTPGIEHSISFN